MGVPRENGSFSEDRKKPMGDPRHPPQQPCHGSKPRKKLLRVVSKLSKSQPHLSHDMNASLPKETRLCIFLS